MSITPDFSLVSATGFIFNGFTPNATINPTGTGFFIYGCMSYVPANSNYTIIFTMRNKPSPSPTQNFSLMLSAMDPVTKIIVPVGTSNPMNLSDIVPGIIPFFSIAPTDNTTAGATSKI